MVRIASRISRNASESMPVHSTPSAARRAVATPACGCWRAARYRAAAKCTACCPVPLPISRTLRLEARARVRTSRIGPLLRSQASEKAGTARVCDNACMQAIDVLLTRRSARTLAEPGPDEGALGLIFASAAHAPDHGRLRPWRFVLVRGAARERLGKLFAEHARRVRPELSAEALERERVKALRAPLIVVVGAECNPALKIPVIEQTIAAGAAAHPMMLAAVALGFNAMWRTGGLAYDELVKRALGFGPTDALVGFLYLGSETGPPAPVESREWRDRVRDWGTAG